MTYTATLSSTLAKLSTLKEKKKKTDERHANGIFTIDEIAKKLGISPTDLKIINDEDDDYMYYEGTRPEDFGELGDGYMI